MITALLLSIVAFGETSWSVEPPVDANIHLRGTLVNARLQFERERRGHVAFIGGSITEMNGYRPMVMEILKRRFPDTEFEFTDAGISSTCSTTGAFRLQDHVLSKGSVDLLFVEFAVNDDQDAGHSRRDCIRGMEGIIRHTREHNPNADIVVTYFVNPEMLAIWQAGEIPLSVAAHDSVARHYGVSTINLAKEVADQIDAGTLTWEQFGGTHPKPFGNAIAAGMIDRMMERAWGEPLSENASPESHAMSELLDTNSYVRGRLLPLDAANSLRGWTIQTPAWENLKGASRSRFSKSLLLCAEQPGDELSLAFEGTAVGAYVLAGPDAGIVETSIDGGPYHETNLFHRFSKGLHYPRTVMFDADLVPGAHTLHVRIAASKSPDSVGHAVRVLNFVAN
ncbi:MAG: SGNH/GDSL hydrolase family protein [Planctomycetaceae bacterium]|nr:SGNH/GDSL hydrolase family protein [Planctomycetaceae bacterium]